MLARSAAPPPMPAQIHAEARPGAAAHRTRGQRDGAPTGGSPSSGRGSSGPAGPGGQQPAQPLDGCPAMPTGNVSSAGHSWTLEGQDDFTKPPRSGRLPPVTGAPCYTGDHGHGVVGVRRRGDFHLQRRRHGYEPRVVQSVHDGVLDWYLHDYKGPRCRPTRRRSPGATSTRRTVASRSARNSSRPTRTDSTTSIRRSCFGQQNDGDYQSAESDFPEGHLSDTSFNAFAHYGGSGAQDAFADTGSSTPLRWHVYTQEWGPGFRSYYIDGSL